MYLTGIPHRQYAGGDDLRRFGDTVESVQGLVFALTRRAFVQRRGKVRAERG